jgi:D-amino-acid dehydrogenase
MKVIVLGGGVVGVTTAYYLLRDGHDVTLIERQAGVARECSHANGGFVAISQAVPWSAPGVPAKTLRTMARPNAPILLHASQIPKMWRWGLEFIRSSQRDLSWANTCHVLRLSLFSFEALKEIRDDTGVQYDRVAGGALKVYSDQNSLDEAVAVSERQRPLGLEFRVLERKECLNLVPALAPRIESIAGGIHFAGEEGGDCFKFTEALAAWCRARGAEFRFDTRLQALETDGARITAARTDLGPLSADAYVLALGADSPLLMRRLGLRLPIIPVKGYSITVPKDPFPDPPTIPVLDEMRKFGLMPLPDRVRMSGLAEIAGYDTEPKERRFRAFVAGFTELFPQLARCLEAAGELRPFCCLRPVTPHGLPILGRSRFANLFYNTGQGHLGWTLAHGSARIVAALVAGRDPGIDLTGLRPAPGQ